MKIKLIKPRHVLACWECGFVELSTAEFTRQFNGPEEFWRCPKCGGTDTMWDRWWSVALTLAMRNKGGGGNEKELGAKS